VDPISANHSMVKIAQNQFHKFVVARFDPVRLKKPKAAPPVIAEKGAETASLAIVREEEMVIEFSDDEKEEKTPVSGKRVLQMDAEIQEFLKSSGLSKACLRPSLNTDAHVTPKKGSIVASSLSSPINAVLSPEAAAAAAADAQSPIRSRQDNSLADSSMEFVMSQADCVKFLTDVVNDVLVISQAAGQLPALLYLWANEYHKQVQSIFWDRFDPYNGMDATSILTAYKWLLCYEQTMSIVALDVNSELGMSLALFTRTSLKRLRSAYFQATKRGLMKAIVKTMQLELASPTSQHEGIYYSTVPEYILDEWTDVSHLLFAYLASLWDI
jgi:hypothetical protein